MLRLRTALLFAFLSAVLAGCDNVGRAFGPKGDTGGTPGPAGESIVQVVPVRGDTRDGRPKVKAAFPSGGGWPTAVPIVIEFSESVNEASIQPTSVTGTDGRIVLRLRGTTQALPCQYDFLAGGRVLVMRPLTALSNAQTPTYEVVLLPDARDVDGVRFLVDGDELLLTDFQVNQDVGFTDGRILTTYPRDNAKDATREGDFYVFFDRPANSATITSSSLRLRVNGGADVVGQRTSPLTLVSTPDPRVVRFRPDAPLQASRNHELLVDDTITFGTDGVLDFRGRTPFAVFDTVGPAAPTAAMLQNPTAGFPNKVNIDNIGVVKLDVTTAVDTLVGDRIVARVYGFDAETTNTADLRFFERTAVAGADGTQTLTLDFSMLFGTVPRPKIGDGPLTFAVQAVRGSDHSAFAHGGGTDAPAFDITRPTLSRAGPPSVGSAFDVVTDQDFLVFYGTASEAVGEARLAVSGSPEVELFATADDGRFMLLPLPLGRRSAPLAYSLSLRDKAGNFADSVGGQIFQRGLVTGTVAGELTVEAYDQGTLLPIAGATVVVDPGAPTVPHHVDQRHDVTGADGRITFAGLTAGDHTITVLRAGYHLTTVFRTGAAFASLPLRPINNATATLQGSALFTQAPSTTVLVGCSAFDDVNTLSVRTENASPTTIPQTPILPNRPAIVTAFGGVFEPTQDPTFSLQGFQTLGSDLLSLVPPPAPAAAGAAIEPNILLLPSAGRIGFLSSPGFYLADFAMATGVDTGNLVGGTPLVRVTASLLGFAGQVLLGVGYSTLDTGQTYKIVANWSQPGFLAFTPFSATLTSWIVAEARDTAGRISRHRAAIDTATGLLRTGLDALPPLAVPTVTPAAPFTTAPLVEFADVLDPATITLGGRANVDLTAVDAAGRRWLVLISDLDAAGGTDTVQLPDLSAAGVPGLQTGTWNVRAEARQWLALTGSENDYSLAERRRVEVLYARGVAVPYTIQ